MPNIQETIRRAVALMGPEILENTRDFSNILEDLAPELSDERKFIAKIYSDDVGKLLAGTYRADISARREHIREIDIFLDNENGINESWRKRFLGYFNALFVGNHSSNSAVPTASAPAAPVQTAPAAAGHTMTAQPPINGAASVEQSRKIYEEAMQADLQDDYETAVKLLSRIKDGSEYEIKAAMYLAEHYSTENPKWSFALYLRAASLGNARAQFLVGYMYEYGEGVAQSIERAVVWYTKAAHNGNRGAQHNLGFFYYSGTGVEQDYKKAFEYFLMAAKQGKPDSMRNVGVMYQLGQYVQKNLGEALKWYKLAADHGDDNALKDYESLKKIVG